MSFTNDLIAGIAQLLDDAGVGTWKPSGAYLAGDDRPIFAQELPPLPNRAIAVGHYRVGDVGPTNDSIEGIQVMNRGLPGDPRPANDDADDISAALDGLQHVDVGGHHVSLIRWQSGAPLGQDANRRWETVTNFYLFTARPSPHRED